jgi:hypothetical protein
VIGRDGGGVEARKLEAAVTIGCAHHRDLDALAAHSCHAARPLTFDGHAAFEGQAKLGEELDGGIQVLHHDADVVHALDCHDVSSAADDTAVQGPVVRRLHVGVALDQHQAAASRTSRDPPPL